MAFLLFVFGLTLGSFFNVVIARIPKGQSVILPASHCMHCQCRLKFYHNIPLFSYLFLKGKCAFCGRSISIQYPLVELLCGFIPVILYYKTGGTLNFAPLSLVFMVLLSLSIIDLYYKAVPDSLNLLALTVAILASLTPYEILNDFINALIFAGAFALLRYYVSYVINKEALGEADIMIAATMGALLGAKLTLIAIFFSALIALPAFLVAERMHSESKEIPFIPFLVLATWIVFIFDDEAYGLINWLYG